jgi:hypothetical protein
MPLDPTPENLPFRILVAKLHMMLSESPTTLPRLEVQSALSDAAQVAETVRVSICHVSGVGGGYAKLWIWDDILDDEEDDDDETP